MEVANMLLCECEEINTKYYKKSILSIIRHENASHLWRETRENPPRPLPTDGGPEL